MCTMVNSSVRENFVSNAHARINLYDVPVTALRAKSRELLAILLDPIKYLPSEEGRQRDWRGLVDFLGFRNRETAFLASQRSATVKLLEMMGKRTDEVISLAELQRILGIIDRWDVVDDTNQSFLEDAEIFLTAKTMIVALPDKSESETHFDDDINVLTNDDAPGNPQRYDAFVLFADEDIEYATELIERLEDSGFKLCEKSRDLKAGHFEHDAICRLIADRCNKLIMIVTRAFLQSEANKFFMNMAQHYSIEKRRRMIIPCVYENVLLPPNLSFYFVLHYQRSGKLYNYWDKLKQSIQNTQAETLASLPANPRITITEVDTPQASKLAIKADDTSPIHPIYNSSKPVLVLKKSYSPEPQRKIMPPPQKMRTVSMWELSSTQEAPGKQLSTSSLSPSDSISPSSTSGSKKGKWYKKLLTPSSRKTSESGSGVEDDAISTGSATSAGKEKTKKRWFTKKKIAVAM
ncbi:myeloid differentiation primary response protein MyD88 [Phlebotomus argentipes]|uniref:myeloid differentiation primary response protein MyD88 n=1 Tax=Phlebotomus argentipes TaxID=94469 RepID=UPI0028937487|nr:myeloid differentiation primary response protein MyD88 [Phlebotomus argentipes]XP_059614114.1 myeloid differentiation primary response protein MyD88 [Phlebotomus argentipes]